MYQTLGLKITGVAPLIMHNSRLADPLDPIAKAMKEITGKRAKTDSDYELLSHLEWLGSLYTTEGGTFQVSPSGGIEITGGFGRPCITGDIVEGLLIQSAKIIRKKDLFKSGVMCEGIFPLEYDGPKDIASLMSKGNFRDHRPVVVNKAKVMRTRPIFKEWSFSTQIHFLPDVIDERAITKAVELGAFRCGLGDYRPKYGRFSVEFS